MHLRVCMYVFVLYYYITEIEIPAFTLKHFSADIPHQLVVTIPLFRSKQMYSLSTASGAGSGATALFLLQLL